MSGLNGKQLIAGKWQSAGVDAFHAICPVSGRELATKFFEATEFEIDLAATSASKAFPALANTTIEQRAALLDRIAAGLDARGEDLVERCMLETAYSEQRVRGELLRTISQTKLFGEMLREGSWVEAKIDHAEPQRVPFPKPDIRSMLQPIGPIVVIGASNFPLAISVAGTDTCTALAAGCPVIVKAHPAHPGTCEMAAEVIRVSADLTGIHPGAFSFLQGPSHSVGGRLVEHPEVKAVAFTGSLEGGRALMDLASRRPAPIPVYAEMGSVNPVVVLPDAAASRTQQIAHGFVSSLTLAMGQFCTNPGLLLVPDGNAGDQLIELIKEAIKAAPAGTMLHAGIQRAFEVGLDLRQQTDSAVLVHGTHGDSDIRTVTPAISIIEAEFAVSDGQINQELFGPFATIVRWKNQTDLAKVIDQLTGQLTATVHADVDEMLRYPDLIWQLRNKAGRMIVNGFPTGVEVCHAMHHGGPYPAASDPHFTSIGPTSIKRFVRPVSYQDYPKNLLPLELNDFNPLGIMRQVDGQYTRQNFENSNHLDK
ncbi:aldehyde dehydrogenase (NADP(+)) [bacterium]|nr:aldehyde dehydrogenase (NADP(+)) [bacterium]